MKRAVLRVFIWGTVLLLIAAVAGFIYLQNVFIPQKLKPIIINAAYKAAGVKIDIKSVDFLFSGILSTQGLTLFEKDIPSQKFITIERASVHFRPLEILFKKQVLINKIELIGLRVYPGPGHTFISNGDVLIEGEFLCNLKNTKNISYNAIITLRDQDIKNMPFVKDIARLSGKIMLVPDKISILELKGNSFGCPVEFIGYLENFKDPYLDLTETIGLDLSKINNFLSPKISNSLKSIDFQGKSLVLLHMSGKFSEWPFKFNGSAKAQGVRIKMRNLTNPITRINADIAFDENSISIPQLAARYNNFDYTLKGNLTSFNAPSVYAILASQDLLLEAKIRTIDDYVRFDSLEATWFNSNINLVGELQDYQKPELKLSGESSINLQDIQKILSRVLGPNEKTDNFLNNLKPNGVCQGSIFLDGFLNDFANCELGMKIGSDNISLSGFNLGALDASAQLKDKIFTIPKFNLKPYDGMLEMDAGINSGEYKINIKAADINIGKLVKDTALKDKNVWGTGSFSCSLAGSGNDLGKLTGQGWILLSDGQLWEFPLLGGLADALKLANLKTIQIKEASGNFIVKDKNISTSNLQFLSPQVNMNARGSLGLYGGLDFNIGVSFAPGFAEQNGLTKLAMILADETGRLLGEIKLSGTFKEPKYSYVPFHLDKVVDTIKGIFRKQ